MNFPQIKSSFFITGFILSGCTASVECDVVSYNELGPPRGEAIQVVHIDPEKKVSSEFVGYSKEILARLDQIGYTVGGYDTPELVFSMNYGITEGEREKDEALTCPLHYNYRDENDKDPDFFGTDCDEHEIWTETYYTHYLEVSIKHWSPTELEELPIYEAQVFSKSSIKQMPKLMPYLIKALFIDFPGKNYVVKSVTLDEQKEWK